MQASFGVPITLSVPWKNLMVYLLVITPEFLGGYHGYVGQRQETGHLFVNSTFDWAITL
jgi:hypothetical protein